jgi:4-nitrophenyl phosphatase
LISDYFENIQALIIDMDGVLWRDTQPLGDLPGIFDCIRKQRLRTILATNNATRTVDEYHEKLQKFGVNLDGVQIINSAQAVGIYLSERYPKGVKVFVVGQPSLRRTLEGFGLCVVGMDEAEVGVVVASLDFNLTYEKLSHASLLIQDGAEFIGTNPDATLPTPKGFLPGSGTVIGALEIAAGVKAKVIGKPAPLLYQMALKQLDVAPEVTLAIGDRLETDIAGAQAANIHTALVLSGASTLAQAETYDPKPELIVKDLTELLFA